MKKDLLWTSCDRRTFNVAYRLQSIIGQPSTIQFSLVESERRDIRPHPRTDYACVSTTNLVSYKSRAETFKYEVDCFLCAGDVHGMSTDWNAIGNLRGTNFSV